MLRSHKKLTKKEIKKDPLIIFTAQALEFLSNEWIKIVSVVGGVVLIVLVSFLIVKGTDRSTVNAYDKAINAYLNNAPEAMDLLEQFVKKHGRSKIAPGVMIQLGNHYFNQKNYEQAETYYTKYIKKYTSDPVYSFNAYNGLGGIYEEKGDYKKAGQIYEEYITKHKNSPFLPIMYLNAGKAYYFAGDKETASRLFDSIIKNYSNSREKKEAQYFKELLS